jgi:hypothetical protein
MQMNFFPIPTPILRESFEPPPPSYLGALRASALGLLDRVTEAWRLFCWRFYFTSCMRGSRAWLHFARPFYYCIDLGAD